MFANCSAIQITGITLRFNLHLYKEELREEEGEEEEGPRQLQCSDEDESSFVVSRVSSCAGFRVSAQEQVHRWGGLRLASDL